MILKYLREPRRYTRRLALLTALATLLTLTQLSAQDNYDYAIGIRGGHLTGVSYKTFIGRYTGYELIAGLNYQQNDAYTVTGLYQYHIWLRYGLNLLAGVGATAGHNGDEFVLNGDLQFGIDYTFYNFPLNVQVDYKPFYSILDPYDNLDESTSGVFPYQLALTFRYPVGRRR